MGLGSMLSEANIGRMTRQGDRAERQRARIVEQNDEIIRLLTEQNEALQYLAQAKSREVSAR